MAPSQVRNHAPLRGVGQCPNKRPLAGNSGGAFAPPVFLSLHHATPDHGLERGL